MKGLIISLAVFAGYALTTAILSHFVRPQRHSRLFFPAVPPFILLYIVVFWITPKNIYFLPAGWIGEPTWLNAISGFVIFILNCLSYIDWFFGFNGGFSMSLLLELWRTGNQGLSTAELMRRYLLTNAGIDKILGWRVPRLEETGYITQDRHTGIYQLTAKGRIVAWLTLISKRLLNLGAGG